MCNGVAWEGSYACQRGGKAFDEREDSLGQREPVSEVVGGGESVGEPVPQPSNNAGWVEKVSLQFNGGRREWGPLAGGSPVEEFSFGDREGQTYVLAPCSDCGEEPLQAA